MSNGQTSARPALTQNFHSSRTITRKMTVQNVMKIDSEMAEESVKKIIHPG